jgi:hypothetical protein
LFFTPLALLGEGIIYRDAISANETATRVVPTPANRLPYTIEAGPPLLRENWKVAAAASQEHCRMKPKLIAETKLMHLYQSKSVL